MNLLYKLGDTKLKRPAGLRKRIYNETNYRTTKTCGTYYVNTLQKWRGKLLMRTFAVYVPKCDARPYNMKIQEVCRRLEGEKEVLLCQIENLSMSGRKVYYTETGEWVTTKDSNNYYSWYTGNRKNWWFFDYGMYDIDEWINKLNIPYCGYNSPNYKYKLPFFQYYELYKQYPKIELLAKMGWGHLITGARYFNFKGKSFEQIFKIPKCWQAHMLKLNISDILKIRKYKIKTFSELDFFKTIDRFAYIKKYYAIIKLEWLEKHKTDLYMYDDYLKFVEKLGMPLQDKKVLYPNDLKQQHDLLMEKIKIVKSKILNDGISKNAEKLEKYQYKNDHFVIMPAKSYDDLAKESAELNHCVRTYADRIAKGETGIMLIRMTNQIDKPFVTLELKGKKIVQVRGKNNHTPPDDVNKFIKKWESQFRLSGW